LAEALERAYCSKGRMKLYNFLNISLFRNVCIRFPLPLIWNKVKYRRGQSENTDVIHLLVLFSFELRRKREQCILENKVTVNRDQNHVQEQDLNTHNQLSHTGTECELKNKWHN